jgi:hypothetical protein
LIYWSLFLVASAANEGSSDSNYVAIASFDNRIACESATKFNNELIVQFDTTDIHLRCLKTDEPVINELTKIKEATELGN